ncbi:exocyst complex subunit Sec15-like-domain-containing protein [Powellomyces hirtus]|nr:exocyst complex subunit Sec15-like-domain-containing protein [Powellomyces hirtus]
MTDIGKEPTEPVTKQEEAAHFQQLLRELALTDTGSTGADGGENFDQIAYIIKQILQTGKEDLFADQLTVFIGKKEAEIEKMCAFHYQEFVQSVDQLLKVRQGTVTLKDKILDLNDQMQASGSKIASKKRDIIENRHTLLNIELGVESLQACLFVLDMANKVNANVENRKYYTALKMLEELQKAHLRPVMHYTFAKHMQDYIPVMQENIREVVLEEVQNWLVNIRENTRAIGRLAMDHVAAKKGKTKHKTGELLRGVSASGSSMNLGPPLDVSVTEEDNDTFDVDVKIDFRPLYQCLHIHEVLNKRNELRTHYEEKRRMQANILLTQKFSFQDGNLTAFQMYLYDVVGFFIIEAAVMNSTQNFRSRGGVEGLWSNAMDKMNNVITDSLQDCRDPDLFLTIKISVVNFIDTMESYGFAVTSLMDLMLSLLDRYAELMKSRCAEAVTQIVDEDEYAPMIVNDQAEYDLVTTAFKLKDESKTKNLKFVSREWASNIRFPKTLPFSKGFPRCCTAIKDFIIGFYRFAEGFEQQYNEMDDLLKKSLEKLISQNLNGSLMSKIMVNNISQVVQILINLEYFELACAEFEELLLVMRISHKAGVVRLQATQALKESRVLAEKRMFDLLNMKMDDFLELADYDWFTQTAQPTYSSYLDDLVGFMNVIISSTLVNLPPHMRSLVYQGAFKHLASSIHSLILAPDVKRVSPAAINILDKDLAFLEKFASGVAEGNVGDAFAQLRQTIALLKSPNIEDILNSAIRDRRYARIQNDKLATLLEKMKGDTSLFAKSTPAEKAHRKSIETVLKGIRSQASSPTR